MAEVQKTTQSGELSQRFIEFVIMHAQNAALFLGQIPNPRRPIAQNQKESVGLELALPTLIPQTLSKTFDLFASGHIERGLNLARIKSHGNLDIMPVQTMVDSIGETGNQHRIDA